MSDLTDELNKEVNLETLKYQDKIIKNFLRKISSNMLIQELKRRKLASFDWCDNKWKLNKKQKKIPTRTSSKK